MESIHFYLSQGPFGHHATQQGQSDLNTIYYDIFGCFSFWRTQKEPLMMKGIFHFCIHELTHG